jgi:hypothetical protein
MAAALIVTISTANRGHFAGEHWMCLAFPQDFQLEEVTRRLRMAEKKDEVNFREKVTLAGEAIFSELYHDGDTDIQTLKEHLKLPSHVFDWALGWLIGKEDVLVTPSNGTFLLRRAAPAPAIFPFRGN